MEQHQNKNWQKMLQTKEQDTCKQQMHIVLNMQQQAAH